MSPEKGGKRGLDSGGKAESTQIVGLPLARAKSMPRLTPVVADLVFSQAKQRTLKAKTKGQDAKVTGTARSATAKMFLDAEEFFCACELLSQKLFNVQGRADVAPLPLLVENLLRPLLEVLGAQKAQGDDWQHSEEAAGEVDRVFGMVKGALERIFAHYVANPKEGWTVQAYTDFAEEFGITKDLKVLTVHRIFYAMADRPRTPPSKYLTFEAFARSLVYLAQWAVEGEYLVTEKLVLMLNRMNSSPGALQCQVNSVGELFNVAQALHDIRQPDERPDDSLTWGALLRNN